MARKLPPLSYLPAFEATARLGSVTRAAAELGRTHGAISKQLQLLQEQVGFPLFDKAGTGIRLNRRGQALLAIVAEALDDLESGYDAFLSADSDPEIHVACSATFAMRWLVPRLADFYRRHPHWRVQLSMTSRRMTGDELERREGVDVVLSWDRLSNSAVDKRAIPLADTVFGPVCAPDYRFTTSGSDMRFQTRIVHEHMSDAWDNWQAATGFRIASRSELGFPHMHLCIGAAVAGLGVTLVEHRLVRDEISSGKLVPQPGALRVPNGFIARTNPRRVVSPTTEAFLSWLREALAEDT
jgi:DNA-binding transcriptional LysR family regulator